MRGRCGVPKKKNNKKTKKNKKKQPKKKQTGKGQGQHRANNVVTSVLVSMGIY